MTLNATMPTITSNNASSSGDTYNLEAGDSDFNEALDSGGDGRVSVFDLLQFRSRFGTSV